MPNYPAKSLNESVFFQKPPPRSENFDLRRISPLPSYTNFRGPENSSSLRLAIGAGGNGRVKGLGDEREVFFRGGGNAEVGVLKMMERMEGWRARGG